MKDRAIGIFDSGVGGIGVLTRAQQLLPAENYIYYADTANFPYGNGNPAAVQLCVDEATEIMVGRGVKALVVACNTATSIAIHTLRARYDFPVLGMEPAVKQAVNHCRGQRIAVVATPLTLQEKKFQDLFDKLRGEGELLLLPAPGLANLVEEGQYRSEAARQYIRRLFADVGTLDGVVLGCTHYLYVAPLIRECYPQAAIFDGGDGTVRHLRRLLAEGRLLRTGETPGQLTVLSSEPSSFLPRFHQFHRDIEDILATVTHIMV